MIWYGMLSYGMILYAILWDLSKHSFSHITVPYISHNKRWSKELFQYTWTYLSFEGMTVLFHSTCIYNIIYTLTLYFTEIVKFI